MSHLRQKRRKFRRPEVAYTTDRKRHRLASGTQRTNGAHLWDESSESLEIDRIEAKGMRVETQFVQRRLTYNNPSYNVAATI